MITKKEVYEIKYIEDDSVKVLAELHVGTDKHTLDFTNCSYSNPKLTMTQMSALYAGLGEFIEHKKGQMELPITEE